MDTNPEQTDGIDVNTNTARVVEQKKTTPVYQIGAALRDGREAQGLTVEQVADRLCFTPQRVREIENNEFIQTTPAKAYARGYVRAYAKLVKLDIDAILAEFDKIEFPEEKHKRSPQLVIKREQGLSNHTARKFGIGIAAMVMLLVGFWWRSAHDATVATESVPIQAELPLQSAPQQTSSVSQQQAQAPQQTEAVTITPTT